MKLVPAKATRTVARAILKSKKISPTIFFVGGVAGVIGSAVLACRATLKLERTLDEIQEDRPLPEKLDLRDRDEHAKEVVLFYARSAVKLGKLYGPSVALGLLSIGSLTGSHRQLQNRNRNLSLAFAASVKAFEEYRGRIASELGEDRERQIHQGQLNTKPGAKGGVQVLEPGMISPYRFVFDLACPEWQPEPAMNLQFLNANQEYWNHKLRTRGHVFLNEVLKSIGMDHTPEGAITGWLWNGDGDDHIDFGIYRLDENIELQIGDTANVWLDFNVDGEIYRKI